VSVEFDLSNVVTVAVDFTQCAATVPDIDSLVGKGRLGAA
jgi:hypothetical protein